MALCRHLIESTAQELRVRGLLSGNCQFHRAKKNSRKILFQHTKTDIGKKENLSTELAFGSRVENQAANKEVTMSEKFLKN